MDRPLRFLIRLLLVSFALLWLARLFTDDVIQFLLPVIRAEVTAIDDNLAILSLDLSPAGEGKTLRLRGNLARPQHYRQGVIYPLGWNSNTAGWYQVDLNAGAALQSSLILLIAVLGWPQRSAADTAACALIAVPLTVILFVLDTPLDLLGNFQEAVIRDLDPRAISPLFAWDKFLAGGGRTALALAFAAIAISIQRTLFKNPPVRMNS